MRKRLLAATVLAATMLGGCGTLINPYLDPSPLNDAAFCKHEETGVVPSSCDVRERFRASQKAVARIQAQAHDGYAQRATVNSLSSAVALPLAAVMLYQGVEHGGEEAVRRRLLKGGLGIGAAYELRNTLIAGSPESVYGLSEARLSCVATEALAYRTEPPPAAGGDTCAAQAAALEETATAIERATLINDDRAAERAALVAKTRATVQRSFESEQRLVEGTRAMHGAVRKIVADTNAALKTSTLSFTQATTLLKAHAQPYVPAEVKSGGARTSNPKAEEELKTWRRHAAALNAFARQCAPQQPESTAPFDACVSYSPSAPPATTISTTLPGNELVLQPGEQRSFIISSTPSGTPWAVWSGGDPAGGAAVDPLQIVTLSPTQSQVTVRYRTGVSAERSLTIALTTLGAVGEPTLVTVKLQPAAGGAGAPAPVANGSAANGQQAGTPSSDSAPAGQWASITGDPALRAELGLPEKADDAQVKGKLTEKWQALCKSKIVPTDEQLKESRFADAVRSKAAPDANGAFCR